MAKLCDVSQAEVVLVDDEKDANVCSIVLGIVDEADVCFH